MKVVQ